jgi:hypothetical protein
MARSPACHSQTANMPIKATAATRSPTTVPLFQGFVCPPYCVARLYDISEPKTSTTPTKSACRNFSFHDACVGLAAYGVWKKRMMMRTVIYCYISS